MPRAAAFVDPSVEVGTYRGRDQKERDVKAGRGPVLVYIDIEMTLLVERDLGFLRPEQTSRVDAVCDPEVVPRWHVTSSTAHCDSHANIVAVVGRVDPA